MIGTVTPNSMIIHANATIQKTVAARIGSNVAAVQIARPVQPAHRGRWVQGDRRDLKVFQEPEFRQVFKARKV